MVSTMLKIEGECTYNISELTHPWILYWINDGSHSIPDDLYIDSYTDAVPKYKEVFKRIFKESGHIAHYNMMMRIKEDPQ